MQTLLSIIDWTLFIILSSCVFYLLYYAVLSLFYREHKYITKNNQVKIAVIFPAYKEDAVIIKSVSDFLEQDYPKDLYDIYVVSDNMTAETNASLKRLPISVLEVDFENSSKAKALNLAMKYIDVEDYSIVVIMDADNRTIPSFLSQINNAFNNGTIALQAHRTTDSELSDIALLDSISEEINNGIFRKGHNAVRLSAALAGSGMAFNAKWFKDNVALLNSVGEDKELEALLLQQNIFIQYIDSLPVFDEKTSKVKAISNQRKRWISVQYEILSKVVCDLPIALIRGNIDYADKIIQWLLPPRLVQLALILVLTIASLFIQTDYIYFKWCILFLCQMLALIIPVPRIYLNKRLLKVLFFKLPALICVTVISMFRLKGASKTFIHTQHGK